MKTNTALLASLPDHLPEHDKLAAARLVQSLLAQPDIYVSINDGEETTVSCSREPQTILTAMGTTDMDVLFVHHRATDAILTRKGTFHLIWGNGPGETISDHTANDFCETHYTVANEPWE